MMIMMMMGKGVFIRQLEHWPCANGIQRCAETMQFRPTHFIFATAAATGICVDYKRLITSASHLRKISKNCAQHSLRGSHRSGCACKFINFNLDSQATRNRHRATWHLPVAAFFVYSVLDALDRLVCVRCRCCCRGCVPVIKLKRLGAEVLFLTATTANEKVE